jgi:N-methylhydantoinase A
MLVTGPKSRLLMSHHQGDGRGPHKGMREAFWGVELGFVETPVLDRYRLGVGDRFEGPLIVEERESTTLVDPAAALTVDENLNLIVDLVAGDA